MAFMAASFGRGIGVAPVEWTVTDYATNLSRVHLRSSARGDK
jgi:hypothetical protein